MILSYLGQDPYDLSECPPSSVVAHILPMISKNQVVKHSTPVLDGATIVAPSIRMNHQLTIPQGEYEIPLSEWTRFSRSFLGHYLQAQGFRVFEEEMIQDEETFLLTPLRRALLRQKALSGPLENVYSQVKREGDFPMGSFGKLARLQLDEEIASLPKHTLNQLLIDSF